MEISDPDQTISLNITHFPPNLLIPSNDNSIIIQAINRFNKQAFFKFAFEAEDLNIIIPDELKKETLQFGPGESKNFEIKLKPIVDGFGKLSMFVNWMKIVEYTVKVKKVRNSVVDSQINNILQKQTLLVSKFTDAFNLDDFMISMTIQDQEYYITMFLLEKQLCPRLMMKMGNYQKKQTLMVLLMKKLVTLMKKTETFNGLR